MARNKNTREPIKANLSDDDIRSALNKIDRRLDELKRFDLNSISKFQDPKVLALETKIDSFLSDVYGNETVEYQRYRGIRNLYMGSISMHGLNSVEKYKAGVADGIDEAIAQLESIKTGFEETLKDNEENKTTKVMRAYTHLELHPRIDAAASQLYRDKHYPDAILNAVKALIELVKERSGLSNLDGTKLMERAFSANNPILKFNDSEDEDEQRGFMQMFVGAVTAIRNPRAHKFKEDHPERALELIAFISLLAKLADETTSVK